VDQFTLTLSNACATNVVSLTTATTDVTYTMLAAGSTPAVTVSASTVGETGTGCTLTRTVEFFDDATNTWEEYSVAAVAWATNQQADASFDI